MNGHPRPVRLLALGAIDRGDDAAGLLAVDFLLPRVRERCEVRRAGGLDVLDLVDLDPGRVCVIADAARGLAPGSVAVVPFEALLDPDGAAPAPRSSHELPVDELLKLATVMRGEPPRGCFVVVGGEQFSLGGGLSPSVEAALPEFVDTLVRQIGEWEACASPPQVA
jgi:hydrogenase maturation protease